jgi:K+-transporting ATPase ATPase A chain
VTTAGWLELALLIVLIVVTTPVLGGYMAKVYDPSLGRPLGDRLFSAIERPIYRLARIDPDSEQRWNTYALSLLAFSLVSVLILYAQLRLQGHLLLNPDHYKGVEPKLSFNTAVSFLTNTNWQAYGDGIMSQFTQMAGLAFHNFVSAAAGAAVAVALIRGLVRRRARTLGNFWVDLVRTCLRVLLPIAFLAALIFMSQGVIDNFHASRTVTTVAGQTQTRRPSRRAARTVAASSAPTRPIRSRTPTGSPTCSSSGSSWPSPLPSPTPSARWHATRARVGWCSPPCSRSGW